MTNQNRILDEIKRLAHKLFANLPVSVYLYGSRARGDAEFHSDWDILIIADDSISTKDAYAKYAYPFTEKGWFLGEQITPILYSRSEWNAERNTAFFLNVKKEAILL
ncbi:MAG: nucleotidyltransferase domain-containing protein [Muribaculaceae bacterium]|nr:nucleotidyltransferase domain-containing protein [Muribaculaceae bacterium]